MIMGVVASRGPSGGKNRDVYGDCDCSVFSPQHNPPSESKFGIRNILRKLVRIVEQSHGYRSHRMQFGRWGSFTSMTSSLPLFFRRVWCESVWSVARGTRSLGVIR